VAITRWLGGSVAANSRMHRRKFDQSDCVDAEPITVVVFVASDYRGDVDQVGCIPAEAHAANSVCLSRGAPVERHAGW
jgi:hypothetical protein